MWRYPKQKVAWKEQAVFVQRGPVWALWLPGSQSNPSALIFKVSVERDGDAFPEGHTAYSP